MSSLQYDFLEGIYYSDFLNALNNFPLKKSYVFKNNASISIKAITGQYMQKYARQLN